MIYNDKNYFIDDRIIKEKFYCDLQRCKGSCCTIKGATGAPILETEIKIIEDSLGSVYKYIPEENKKIIEAEGYYKIIEGELSLNNVDDNECVFSYYDSGIAKCSFQKAYLNKEIGFKKPISCELFPIRISGKNSDTLRYEKFYECEDAISKGNENNITILEFVKDALIRRFGDGFYEILVKKSVIRPNLC